MLKKTITVKALLAILFVLSIPSYGLSEIKGEYTIIQGRSLPEDHSLKQVTIHEVFAFDCPHCYYFYRDQHSRLEEKFGDKIRLIPQPIGWRGHDPGRLMFIAQEKGREHSVILMIFDFIFDKGLGESMFERDKLQYVAQMNGLSAEFKSRMDDPDIVQKMNDSVQFSRQRKIDSTPTLVIEDAIKPEAYYTNLVSIINSLLIEPVN